MTRGILPFNYEKENHFPIMGMDTKNYKIFGIVTNMDWDGQKLILWFYRQCGKSEEAIAS